MIVLNIDWRSRSDGVRAAPTTAVLFIAASGGTKVVLLTVVSVDNPSLGPPGEDGGCGGSDMLIVMQPSGYSTYVCI